ncbi:hypothetical protein QBC46DRAFT_440767 [Diplogelasinospora grovesii]|uniref:Zn(2)-C6 fungal-type domain-containing protein n=1 Tax=Diplogelasinospora grovesii TaxID=303347 RepID=A0AAN6NFC9_9PEZI|nr:hypothetical protein QBC46DRAFT_440767 [Diplogelasinospora grovesii]
MVYGGKPSRGCRTCRARRIKCDEGRPTCKKCAKSKRECGGYRSEFEIVHRDETRTTVQRNSSRPAVWQQHHSAATPVLVFVHEHHGLPTPRSSPARQDSPPPPLSVPIAQQAACYFASNFILMPRGEGPYGYMEYLVPLLRTEMPGRSALQHAFNACGLAALGNKVTSERVNFSELSLKEHSQALVRTHEALGNPATANSDATLAAVLLLCLFESITAIKETRMLAWRSHIEGAAHIVQSRGREQMRTKTASLLFNAVRHHIMARTLSSGIAPPVGVDWWMGGGDTDSLSAKAQHFGLETAALRAEVSSLMTNLSRTPESVGLMGQMRQRVQAIDQEIAEWMDIVPEQSRPRTLCCVWEENLKFTRTGYGDIEVFPGRVDVYPDFMTASTWNVARVTRLILASLNIRLTAWLCSPADYRTTAEYATAKRICEGTISDVLASVPYHLGWHTKRRELFENNPELSGFACGLEEGPHKVLPSLLLIWSIACVKNHDLTTEDQRAWAKGRLRFIADEMGLKYARLLHDAELRFPSMMIRQDGLMVVPDPFVNKHGSGLPIRPRLAPPTPVTPGPSG